MKTILELFILVPLAGFLITLFLPSRSEKWISRVAFATTGLHFFFFLGFAAWWLWQGHPTLNLRDISIYQSGNYDFFLDFYFDKVSAIFCGTGALLTFMVTIYSRVYLHREQGYKRFFSIILFFYSGYNLIIFSGNLETLFTGWEVLGISSYLLIAFYRDRYLPVRNAFKVYSIYRLGDIGIILAMWLSHHLFGQNITFAALHNGELVTHQLHAHTFAGITFSMLILLAAAGKSAQLPFSSWLPRAMEGPTPSSAIFYGSLSVHLGAFLLLRTFPFWEHQPGVRIAIAALGGATSLVAIGIARVQTSVKSQISYASIVQIGLIFIEIAAGLHVIALFHFAGNAFLRTYQLLTSPSVVSYLIREQFYSVDPPRKTIEDKLPKWIQYSFYLWSLKEWNLDSFINFVYRAPVRKAGELFAFLSFRNLLIFSVPAGLATVFLFFDQEVIPPVVLHGLPPVLAAIGLIMVARSFTERKNVFFAWTLVVLNHFWIAMAVSFNEHFTAEDLAMYVSGIAGAGMLGYACLWWLKKKEPVVSLDTYKGHASEHPRLAIVFLLACLGITGFPVSPTFIGEDLIFSHIHEHQFMLALFTSLGFVIDGLAVMRIFSRLFLGIHIKTYHEVPYKSA